MKEEMAAYLISAVKAENKNIAESGGQRRKLAAAEGGSSGWLSEMPSARERKSKKMKWPVWRSIGNDESVA
jgi:hypothetical protein